MNQLKYLIFQVTKKEGNERGFRKSSLQQLIEKGNDEPRNKDEGYQIPDSGGTRRTCKGPRISIDTLNCSHESANDRCNEHQKYQSVESIRTLRTCIAHFCPIIFNIQIIYINWGFRNTEHT